MPQQFILLKEKKAEKIFRFVKSHFHFLLIDSYVSGESSTKETSDVKQELR